MKYFIMFFVFCSIFINPSYAANNFEKKIGDVQAGRIALQNSTLLTKRKLLIAPARLVCDKQNFIAQMDPVSGDQYFDFATLFSTVAPSQSPTTPISLTNCSLRDSAATPTVYAIIPSITNLGVHAAQDGSGLIWAANMSDFLPAPIDFLVKKTQSIPAKDDVNAFNQYNMTISPIIQGDVLLAGGIINFTDDMYVACDSAAPVKLINWTLDLYAFHGELMPMIPVNYAHCVLESDPAKPNPINFITFSVANLQGNYATDASAPPMWGMQIFNIVPGNSAYGIDLPLITSSCDYQNPVMCNQTTLNFTSPTAGKIDFINLPEETRGFYCDGSSASYPSTPIPGGISIDLSVLHGNDTDPSIDKNLNHCELIIGLDTIGPLNLQNLSGAHVPPNNPDGTMWAAQLTANGAWGIASITSDNCDKTGIYCNHWVVTVS